MRDFTSENTVPAYRATGSTGINVLLDARLTGGAGGSAAVQADTPLYARNVVATGYGQAVAGSSGLNVAEGLFHGDPRALFSSAPPRRSLGLEARDTPRFEDPDLSHWARFEPAYYGDTAGLQALFDSGATTVYFPFGNYYSFDERVIHVPATVRRVIGFSGSINSDWRGVNGGGIRLVVDTPGGEPLIVEQFGYGMRVEQRSSRPVVIRHGNYSYTSTPGAGDLYLEDVEDGDFHVQPGQHVWARQFNNESGGTKILNDNGQLWILGLKTEAAGTVIDTRNGGRTELLGGLIYPAAQVPASDVAFVSRDSQTSLMFQTYVFCGGCGYTKLVQETRGSDTRVLAADTWTVPLYVGY
jgi:hypothetical protein